MEIHSDMAAVQMQNISESSEMLTDVLQSAALQATDIAGDLIAMNAEARIDIGQLETMGNAIDTYA